MTDVTQNGYRLQPYTLTGAPLAQIVGYTGLRVAYGERNPGVCIVQTNSERAAQDWPPFTMLEVYRTVEGITYLEGDRIWYLLDQEDYYDESGQRGQRLYFYDMNTILAHRYVLYAAGSEQADKTDQCDDMLKEIIRDNLGRDVTVAAREVAGLLVAANLSACASVSKAFAWRNCLEVMREICQQSLEDTTTPLYLTWDFVRDGIGTQTFHTYTGQRGTNRGQTSGQRLGLTWENGGLKSPSLIYARYGSANHVTAGGQGEEALRYTKTVDATPAATGITRLETFVDARNCVDNTDVDSEALAEFAARQPRYKFTAQLGETTNRRYGYDVHYGDLVSVSFGGYDFDAHLDAVSITLDGDGNETLSIGLRNE